MPQRASNWRWLLWAVLIAVAIGALVFVLWQPQVMQQLAPAQTPPQAPVAAAPIVQAPLDVPKYPIDPVAAALPPLDASDESLLKAMEMLWLDGGGITSYLTPTNLVRNFVATIDNIPRQTWAAQRLPVKPPVGAFGTTQADADLVGNPANAMRYAPYVRLLESVDNTKLVALYVRNYPLFQEAYRELGYPRGNFNDRLVDALDTMIAAPEITGPIALTQPKVLYQFADSELEQLPAGQKLMLRMGAEHAKSVKQKLRELRRMLTAKGPGGAPAMPAAAKR